MARWRCQLDAVMTSSLQEAILSHLGAILAGLGAILARLGALLGPSWGHLGGSWSHPGSSKMAFSLGRCAKNRKLAMLSSGCYDISSARNLLELSWAYLRPSGAYLGPSWGRLGSILAIRGAILGPLGGLKTAFSLGRCAKNGKLTM